MKLNKGYVKINLSQGGRCEISDLPFKVILWLTASCFSSGINHSHIDCAFEFAPPCLL